MEKSILSLVRKTKPKLDIIGLRGLVKTGENEWSFRYTYRKGDDLSMSDLFKVKFDELRKKPTFIVEKKESKKSTSKRTKRTI